MDESEIEEVSKSVKEAWWDDWAEHSIGGVIDELENYKQHCTTPDQPEYRNHIQDMIDQLEHIQGNLGEELEEVVIEVLEEMEK